MLQSEYVLKLKKSKHLNVIIVLSASGGAWTSKNKIPSIDIIQEIKYPIVISIK